ARTCRASRRSGRIGSSPDRVKGAAVREIGVNTWVWVSPLTDARLGELADRARGFGFDLLELPVEHPHGWDAGAAAEALAARGMGARIVGAMGPGRDLIDETARADTQDYLRHCVEIGRASGRERVETPVRGGA